MNVIHPFWLRDFGRGAAVACVLTASVSGSSPWQNAPFGPPTSLEPGIAPVARAAAADLNRDGVPDVLAANRLFAVTTGTIVAHLLEDTGRELATAGSPRSTLLPAAINLTSADVDGDGLEDVLTVDVDGHIQLWTNSGPPFVKPAVDVFAPPTDVLDLGAIYGKGSGEGASLPVFFASDIDADGLVDLVVAGKFSNVFTRVERATDLLILWNDGNGGFANRSCLSIGRAAVAGTVVDLDRDGQTETIALLTDLATPSSYSQSIELISCTGRAPVRAQPIIPLTIPGRAVALEVSDMDGDGTLDYVLPAFGGLQQSQDARLYSLAAMPNGLPRSGYTQHPLPVPPALPNEIPCVRVRDFDGDGFADMLAVQAFDDVANARLVYFAGRGQGQFLSATVRDLGQMMSRPNANVWPSSQTMLQSTPDALAIVDFDGNRAPDVIVAGLYREDQSTTEFSFVTLVNQNPAGHASGLRHIGRGRVAASGVSARIGTTGGAATAGNREFGLTLTDTAGLSPAFLHVGPIEYHFTYLQTLRMYTIPMLTSAPYVTAGRGADDGYLSRLPVPIPDDPTLVGQSLYFQWAVLIPGAGALPVYTSDALEVTIGPSASG